MEKDKTKVIDRIRARTKPENVRYVQKNLKIKEIIMMLRNSGTTAIACLNTNRNCIGIELDEEYFSIAQKRVAEKRKEQRHE